MLTKRELFAAAASGDIVTMEHFFAQPSVRSHVLGVEHYLTDDKIITRARHHQQLGVEGSWVYSRPTRPRELIFQVIVANGQYDALAWLVSSPMGRELRRTIQFFLEDAAIQAIDCGDVYALELLLTSTAWATFPDDAKVDTLSSLVGKAIATWRGSGVVLELLVAHGADCSRHFSPDGYRLIIHAADHEFSGSAITALTRHGVFVVGECASLHRAVRARHLAVVVALLSAGADPRSHRPGINETPLHLAAERGLHEIAATLLETSCVDIDARNAMGDTALASAAITGSQFRDNRAIHLQILQTVKTLLAHGARTEISDPTHYAHPPLYWAVQSADVDMVHALLTHGADPNFPATHCLATPTHCTAEKIRTGDLLRKDLSGATPFAGLCASEAGRAWLHRRGY